MRHEEPLVRLGDDVNALSISPIVNTKEYHDAFLAMPLPRVVSESAYCQAGRILSVTDGTEYEHLVAIDARTGALVADNLDEQPLKKGTTGFDDSNISKIEECCGRIVLLHNHPASRPPSYRDVMTAAEDERIAASIVIGHDGPVWYISVQDGAIAGHLAEAYNGLKDYAGDIAESLALRAVLDKENGKHIDWRRMR